MSYNQSHITEDVRRVKWFSQDKLDHGRVGTSAQVLLPRLRRHYTETQGRFSPAHFMSFRVQRLAFWCLKSKS